MQNKCARKRNIKFFKTVAGVVVPVLAVTLTAGALLKILNEVPDYIQPERKNVEIWGSVEEAERALRVNIMLPSYSPDYLVWPPESITSRKRPVLKVTLQFSYENRDQLALTLEESFPKGGEKLELVSPPRPWRKEEISVNELPGHMFSWVDERGFLWHKAKWADKGRHFEVYGVLPEEEFKCIINSIFR